MIKRDMDLVITKNMRRRFIDKLPIERDEQDGQEEKEELNRILIIGPNYGLKCHFSENIHDAFVANDYDALIIDPRELSVNKLHLEKGMHYPINRILSNLNNWMPQLIIVDECGLNFSNNQSIPVFYHHREFKRPPSVFYPTVAFFWHEDVIKYYEKMFAKEWMAQVQYKRTMNIAYNPKIYKPRKKEYKGISGIGVRETFQQVYKMDELANIADAMIMERERKEVRQYINYFEPPIDDNEFRELIAKCEAVWLPISVRQYTTRAMLEAMGCKTVCIIKLENDRHKEILEKMDLFSGTHYVCISNLNQLGSVVFDAENITKKAYNLVKRKHTYENRMLEIVDIYNKITSKKR